MILVLTLNTTDVMDRLVKVSTQMSSSTRANRHSANLVTILCMETGHTASTPPTVCRMVPTQRRRGVARSTWTSTSSQFLAQIHALHHHLPHVMRSSWPS